MDSPVVTQLFRQLFRHPACQYRQAPAASASCLQHGRRPQHQPRHHQRRTIASRPTVRGAKPTAKTNESDWQQRTELFPQDLSNEYNSYPLVTAKELRNRKERPRKVKMLMRDFIDGSYSFAYPQLG
jgi:hypothetical protein